MGRSAIGCWSALLSSSLFSNSMMGTPEQDSKDSGVIPRFTYELFERISQLSNDRVG